MRDKTITMFVIAVLVLALGGCTEPGDTPPDTPGDTAAAPGAEPAATQPVAGVETEIQQPAETETTPVKLMGRPYFPFGDTDATVIIRPTGNAVIASINGRIDTSDGKPVPVLESLSEDYFDRIVAPPGRYRIYVENIASAPVGGEIEFAASPGIYIVQGLTYEQGGTKLWTPIVTEGDIDGPIVAARGEIILGLTVAAALELLTAKPEDTGAAASAIASEELNEAIERANDRFEAGRKFFEQRRMFEALDEFTAAVSIAPGFDTAYVYRAMTLTRLDRQREALAEFDKAMAAAKARRGADTNWLWWPHYQKAVALIALRLDDDALWELDESLRLKPTAGAFAARGNIFFLQGQSLASSGNANGARQYYMAAGADVRKGLRLKPDHVSLWSMKSGLHFMLGEQQQACEAARKACELGNCGIVEEYTECKVGG